MSSSHCLVAIFTDSQGTWAEYTGMKSQVAAYKELRDMLTANSTTPPDWIGWSYWDAHPHDGTLIKDSLEDLAKHLENLFTHGVKNRRSFNPLRLLTPTFKVEVRPKQIVESQHGFMYAKIIKN